MNHIEKLAMYLTDNDPPPSVVHATKYDGIVVDVEKDNNKAVVTIVGHKQSFSLSNRSNEILTKGDCVVIQCYGFNLSNGFIIAKYGEGSNLAEEEIKEIIVEYAVNDSPIVAPAQDDPSWSSTSINRPLDRYIWQRTRIVYANKETFSVPVNITGANGSTPPLCNIYGENIFKYDVNGELISGDTITLTADVIGTTISKWQYKDGANDWIDYPIGEVSNISLVVSATDNVFFNDVATIRCTTQVVSAQDIVSITKIRDGSGVGIDKIQSYYLATSQSSGVTTETLGWTTTIQTTTKDKKYLWTYEEIEYSNATSSNSPPIIIGTFSVDGVSIETVVEYYKADENGVNPPITGWTTEVQTITPTKKYLWNYEEITFNDASTHITDKRIIGVYGESAYTVLLSNENVTFAGVAIADSSSAISLIQAFLGVTPMPTSVGEIQNLPNGMSYTVQNNNTTSTQITISVDETFESKNGELQIPITVSEELFTKTFSYSLVLNGEQGVGVATIINEFYLSTSKTELVGGEWGLTSPTWEKGLYVWVRQKIVYTDETIEYTEPLVDSSWEAVNDLEQQIDNQIALIEQQQEDLKEQVDGQVSSWFYPYNPTLENIPASDWTTDELKTAHVGDTFTNIEPLDVEIKDTLVQFDNGIEGTYANVEIKANPNEMKYSAPTEEMIARTSASKERTLIDEPLSPSGKALRYRNDSVGNQDFYGITNFQNTYTIPQEGEKWTWSVWLKGEGIIRCGNENGGLVLGIELTNEWKFYSHTFTATGSIYTSFSFARVAPYADIPFEVIWHSLKLERVTDISPNGEATVWIPNLIDEVDTPTYELTRCGKNLVSDTISYEITSSQESQIGTNFFFDMQKVNFKNKKQLSFSYYNYSIGEFENIGTSWMAGRFGMHGTGTGGLATYPWSGNVSVKGVNNVMTSTKDIPDNTDAYLRYFSVNIGAKPSENNTDIWLLKDVQLEVGLPTSYELYNGETYTITPNTPLKLLIKKGVNTFYTVEGVDLTVSYQNSDSGKSYKFTKTDGIYFWDFITDNNIQQALKQSADVDGKSTHFITQPIRYQKGDLWTLAEDFNEYRQGDILTATQDSDTFVATHWIKSNSYLDQVGADDHFLPLIENNSSLIEQKANEIILMVEQTYSTEEDLVALRQTLIELTAEQIEFVRTTLGGDINEVDGKVDGNQALLEEYIRFVGAMIELGRSDSPYKVQLTNDRLSFLQEGQEIAYMSNKKMFITEVEIKTRMDIGNFAWQPRSNGNLSLVYRGGV